MTATHTHNILCAIAESGQNVHVVHVGSMGVYGYARSEALPERYWKVEVVENDGGRVSREILRLPKLESIYHVTKSPDQVFFQYYNENARLRITDLHQGVVWGTNTRETTLNLRLVNRF